jgi:anti-sigma regulatory factor (Ser/Thr protein kinase)
VTDEIRLTLPAQEDFRHVAHLVVGGLAARLDLTFEDLEDLQVAVEAVLACRDDDAEISVTFGVDVDAVRTTVGPFSAGSLAELDDDSSGLGLRRVLETVCDDFEIEQRDGDSWIALTKRTAAPAGAEH